MYCHVQILSKGRILEPQKQFSLLQSCPASFSVKQWGWTTDLMVPSCWSQTYFSTFFRNSPITFSTYLTKSFHWTFQLGLARFIDVTVMSPIVEMCQFAFKRRNETLRPVKAWTPPWEHAAVKRLHRRWKIKRGSILYWDCKLYGL